MGHPGSSVCHMGQPHCTTSCRKLWERRCFVTVCCAWDCTNQHGSPLDFRHWVITAMLLPDCSLGQGSRDHSDAFPIFLGVLRKQGCGRAVCHQQQAGIDPPS